MTEHRWARLNYTQLLDGVKAGKAGFHLAALRRVEASKNVGERDAMLLRLQAAEAALTDGMLL